MSDLIDLKAVIINMLKEWKETVVKVKKKTCMMIILYQIVNIKKKEIKRNQMEILELKSAYNYNKISPKDTKVDLNWQKKALKNFN